jgi:asparaginyl-tRNA synthetase
VVDSSVATPSRLMPTGTCILVEGLLERPPTEGKHAIQLKAEKVFHIGTVDVGKYPLSKKRVPLDTLREYSHFRPRTTTVKFYISLISYLILCILSFDTIDFLTNTNIYNMAFHDPIACLNFIFVTVFYDEKRKI